MGKIKDLYNGSLLGGVVFTLEENGQEKYKDTTGNDGRFKISSVAPGTYDVRTVLPGHQTKLIKGFIVKANIINFIDVDLVNEKPLTKKERRDWEKKHGYPWRGP